MQKFIDNLFENEETIKDLVDVLYLFMLQVTKKDDTFHPSTRFDL
jgi:hypothetical protein